MSMCVGGGEEEEKKKKKKKKKTGRKKKNRETEKTKIEGKWKEEKAMDGQVEPEAADGQRIDMDGV